MAQREIKFRAWDTEDNEIYIPEALGICKDGSYMPLRLCKDGNRAYKPHPIMQFTGLHDKNGKEIYEGDILTSIYGDGNPCAIKFGEFSDYITADFASNYTIIGFYWDEGVRKKSAFGKSIDGNMEYCEVIGNIYETPDLLK